MKLIFLLYCKGNEIHKKYEPLWFEGLLNEHLINNNSQTTVQPRICAQTNTQRQKLVKAET